MPRIAVNYLSKHHSPESEMKVKQGKMGPAEHIWKEATEAASVALEFGGC